MENEKNSSEGNMNSYDFVYKYISTLSNEIKERKDEIEILKNQIKQQKKEYNQGLQHYLSLNSKLITTENELEKIYNKKSKIQKEFIIQLFSINKVILKKLKDPTNIPNNNICKLVLFFLGYRKNEAKRNYIEARNNYMANRTNENWIAFCNAKILCRRLGVLI